MTEKPKKKRIIPRCEETSCKKGQVSGYQFCIAHGGGKRCKESECTKTAKTGGYCGTHGGGKRCAHKGCTTGAAAYGYCCFHGGGLRCLADDCMSHRITSSFFCRTHCLLNISTVLNNHKKRNNTDTLSPSTNQKKKKITN